MTQQVVGSPARGFSMRHSEAIFGLGNTATGGLGIEDALYGS